MRLGHGRRTLRAAFVFALLVSANSGEACAGWFDKPEAPQPPPSPEERHWRAGYPTCLSRWADFSFGPTYTGYYVGGGSAFGGEPRYVDEGTWGLDYAPTYSRVILGWTHGRRYQGGGGQYESDRKNRPFRPRLHR